MDYYVGIDLGGTELKIGIIDQSGSILIKDSFKVPEAAQGSQIVKFMGDCTQQLMDKSQFPKQSFKGIGIGAPGLLNPETGQLLNVVNIPQLNSIYLAPDLGQRFGIPTWLDNDVNAMALGEMFYGAGKGYKDCIALTLGTGVGGGLIFDGKLYRGACFTAGEIGHLSINSDGLLCPCGNYGCIERYIGRDGIISRFKYYLSKEIPSTIHQFTEDNQITPKAIAKAAEAGDALSREVLAETGKYLGIALVTLTNVLNPEVFIIGGGIANAGDLILEPARHELQKRAYTIPAKKVKVVQAALRNDAGIVGSASIAVDMLKNR
ncbi:MAG: ROK family protein [Candidatus Delongbacteria bacterium]|nr:ROK family protein [Candidatus Delongbacteria bacterium]